VVDIKQAANWMLDGHQISREGKGYYFCYDYNEPNEEFGLTLDDLRATDWKINKKFFVQTKPNLVMYVFANKEAKMSPGKLSAQVAHGACFAQLNSDQTVIKDWIKSGFTKVILEVKDEYALKEVKNQLIKEGVRSYLITDSGKTEIASGTVTALGVQILDKNKYNDFFNKYKLYKKESWWTKFISWFKKIFKKNKDEYK